MEKLRAEEDKRALDKKASLEGTITGSVGSDSASIINYRDAQDRADKLETNGEAARMMTRALNSGDKTLASAVAQAAVEKGWNDVYLRPTPDRIPFSPKPSKTSASSTGTSPTSPW